jgi:hypothetical protein
VELVDAALRLRELGERLFAILLARASAEREQRATRDAERAARREQRDAQRHRAMHREHDAAREECGAAERQEDPAGRAPRRARGVDGAQRLGGAGALLLERRRLGLEDEVQLGLLAEEPQALVRELAEALLQELRLLGLVALARESVA